MQVVNIPSDEAPHTVAICGGIMVSKTAEYAIRAVLYMARREHQTPVNADEVADALGAPRNYLSKTLNALAKARILKSVRGPRGGFSLAVAAEDLPIARIVDAFDSPRESGMCMLGGTPCNPDDPCSAHDRWISIRRATRAPMEDTTVGEMIGWARNRPRLALER